MNVDRPRLEPLQWEECIRLLSTTRIGRIAFHSQAVPMILPVSYAMDDQGIVVRMRAGSQLDRSTRDAVVAFEADDVDPGLRRAWSVAVIGVVRDITDAGELEVCRGLGLDDWPSGGTDRFARISLEVVSGRRRPPAVASDDVVGKDAPVPATDPSAPTNGHGSRPVAVGDVPCATAPELDASRAPLGGIAGALASVG